MRREICTIVVGRINNKSVDQQPTQGEESLLKSPPSVVRRIDASVKEIPGLQIS